MTIQDVFGQLQSFGLFDVLLPFVLIFTIVFAVLNKAKLFGPAAETRKYNVMIALCMGAAVIFPHVMGIYPPDGDIVNIINTSLPHVSVVLVAAIMALLIMGVFGAKIKIGGNSLSGWLAVFAFGVIVFIFGDAANWWNAPWFGDVLGNSDLMALIIVILAFAIIIWFVTKTDDPSGKKPTMLQRLNESVEKID